MSEGSFLAETGFDRSDCGGFAPLKLPRGFNSEDVCNHLGHLQAGLVPYSTPCEWSRFKTSRLDACLFIFVEKKHYKTHFICEVCKSSMQLYIPGPSMYLRFWVLSF